MRLARDVQRAIAAVDPTLPMASVTSLRTLVDDSIAAPRFSMLTIALFGAIAIALASIGLYGAAAYAASQRTQEIGVRVALGATRRDIVAMMVRRGAIVTLAGTAIGVPIAIAVAQVFRTFLFGVTPTDALTFAAVPGLLVAVGLAASYVPARQAASVDPLVALRTE